MKRPKKERIKKNRERTMETFYNTSFVTKEAATVEMVVVVRVSR